MLLEDVEATNQFIENGKASGPNEDHSEIIIKDSDEDFSIELTITFNEIYNSKKLLRKRL